MVEKDQPEKQETISTENRWIASVVHEGCRSGMRKLDPVQMTFGLKDLQSREEALAAAKEKGDQLKCPYLNPTCEGRTMVTSIIPAGNLSKRDIRRIFG